MNMVNAKCPFCGEIVKVDKRDEAVICSCCKKPFVTEKAIQNLNKSMEEEQKFIVKDSNLERLLQKAEFFQKIGEQQEARNLYEKITHEYPEDYRGWLNLVGRGNERAINILYKICNPMPISIKEEISRRMIEEIEDDYSGAKRQNTIGIPIQLWESDVKYCPIFFEGGYNRAKEYIKKYSEKGELDILKRSILEAAAGIRITEGEDIVCLGREYSKQYLPNLIDGILYWRLERDFSYTGWDEHIYVESKSVRVTRLEVIEDKVMRWELIRKRKKMGVCIYCGGKISAFSGKCKECRRNNSEGVY